MRELDSWSRFEKSYSTRPATSRTVDDSPLTLFFSPLPRGMLASLQIFRYLRLRKWSEDCHDQTFEESGGRFDIRDKIYGN